MLGLINDILDLSKIESGEFTLNPEIYTIDDLNSSINTIIRPIIERKNIEFVYEISTGIYCIMTDRLRFNQIFFNLLSNAAKFTNEHGKIEFLGELLEKKDNLCRMRFIVRDNGIGMSSEFMEHLFVPFVQENIFKDNKNVGTGLGLPIVKSLVDAMKGTIQVAKKLLENQGCVVTVATDGQKAIDIFKQSKVGFFAAILMDVRMPVMDGLTATRLIRQLERKDATRIPIIAMTADAFTEEQKKTSDAGMNYHLAKPIVPKQLFEVLSKYIMQSK